MIYADFKSILLAEYNVRAKYTNKIRANIKNMLLAVMAISIVYRNIWFGN